MLRAAWFVVGLRNGGRDICASECVRSLRSLLGDRTPEASRGPELVAGERVDRPVVNSGWTAAWNRGAERSTNVAAALGCGNSSCPAFQSDPRWQPLRMWCNPAVLPAAYGFAARCAS